MKLNINIPKKKNSSNWAVGRDQVEQQATYELQDQLSTDWYNTKKENVPMKMQM